MVLSFVFCPVDDVEIILQSILELLQEPEWGVRWDALRVLTALLQAGVAPLQAAVLVGFRGCTR